MATSIRNASRKHSAAGIFGHIMNYLLPILTAIAAVFYIGTVFSYEAVICASVNGVPAGYVQSADTFTQAELALEKDIADQAGIPFDPGASITYELVHVKNPQYLTETDCYEILWNTVADEFTPAYMLYVDDRQAAAYEDGEQLNALIAEIESELLESGGEAFSNVRISNALRIEKQLCHNSMFRSIDDINELLNPLAHMAAAPEAVMLAEETEESPVTLRVNAYAPASPGVAEEAAHLNPDIDYGVNRSAASAEHTSESDMTLDYTFVNTVTQLETVYYQTQYIDDYNKFIGTNEEITEGQDGSKLVTYELSYDAEGNLVDRTAVEERIITPSVDRIVIVGAKEIPAPVPTGTFIWPCDTPKGISSGYGWRVCYGKKEFHLGIDLPDVKGSPIWASDGGEVVWAGYTPSYGYSIRIQHDDDYMTVYAHLSKMHVSVGDHVYQGQHIGDMGSTGMSYGSHLHFEVRIGSTTYDPVKYLPARDFSQN